MKADNSSGGQVWVEGDQWGPFKNDMLLTSYGMCSLFHVMSETVDGQEQAAVARFPLEFSSGIMRARFNPHDGQLYLSGLRGWQTRGGKDGVFCRVRFTGKPLRMPAEMHVKKTGVEIRFTCDLDPEAAADEGNYAIQQYNYRWTAEYGSADYSVANPSKKGRDEITVKTAKLLPDKKTVFLEIDDLKPVMQMEIHYKIKSADGKPFNDMIYNTINKVGK